MTSGTACNDHVVVDGVEVKPDQQRELEHSLATTFTTMQRERVPAKRQELWAERLRLARQLEKLND